MNDVSAGSYLTPLSVARRFGLTVVVSDYYGNIVLSHRPSVNISLVEDASPAVALLDRVIGRRHTSTHIPQENGQVEFKNLHIDITGARCEKTECVLPNVRLQVITDGTNSSRDRAIVRVFSTAFQVHHDNVITKLQFAHPPAASSVAETRAPALYVQAHDRFGNIAVRENTRVCAKMYGDDGVQFDVSLDPAGDHSIEDESSLILNGVEKTMSSGVAPFSLILRRVGEAIKLEFWYECDNAIPVLKLFPVSAVPINHLQIITSAAMPNYIAGDLIRQPAIMLRASKSPTCPR